MSDEEYRKHKQAEKEKQQLKAGKKAYENNYGRKYDPTPKVDELETDDVEKDWMKPVEWVAGWGLVEFDADACLKNVTKKGETKDGFFAPAGTWVPPKGSRWASSTKRQAADAAGTCLSVRRCRR